MSGQGRDSCKSRAEPDAEAAPGPLASLATPVAHPGGAGGAPDKARYQADP